MKTENNIKKKKKNALWKQQKLLHVKDKVTKKLLTERRMTESPY